jgi:hypothetical protein
MNLEANAKRLAELEAKDAVRRARLAQVPAALELLEAMRLDSSRPS